MHCVVGFSDDFDWSQDPHGVISGGDWALDRIGAVFLEGTIQTTIQNCFFYQLDGVLVFALVLLFCFLEPLFVSLNVWLYLHTCQVSPCVYTGNGLFISGFNRNTTVFQNEFAFMGGNAIASWGRTNDSTLEVKNACILLDTRFPANLFTAFDL